VSATIREAHQFGAVVGGEDHYGVVEHAEVLELLQ
jgi:hypothetical protein